MVTAARCADSDAALATAVADSDETWTTPVLYSDAEALIEAGTVLVTAAAAAVAGAAAWVTTTTVAACVACWTAWVTTLPTAEVTCSTMVTTFCRLAIGRVVRTAAGLAMMLWSSAVA